MTLLLVIVIIGFVILVHEGGHFLAAKGAGIPISRFSIGFGPRLWGFERGGTEYRLSVVPLGGYVLPAIEDEQAFFEIPVLRRIVFTLGGPLANVLLCAAGFGIVNALGPDASLHAIIVKPFVQTYNEFLTILSAIPAILNQPDNLSGVVGIVAQGSGYIGASMMRALHFAMIISLNLAVFNLFPIPALDGGKILLYLMEKVHPKANRLAIPLSVAGWILLVGLMGYVTVLDVGKLITGA